MRGYNDVMDAKQFETYAKEFFARMVQNLRIKGDNDYATEEDRLYNFRAAAPILGSPAKACLAYATKHFMSIARLVNEGNPVPKEVAMEKLGDLATYMVLLYAIMEEQNDADVGARAE